MEFLYIYVIWFLIFMPMMIRRRNHRAIVTNLMINKSRTEKIQMFELAKKFIEKECCIYTFEGNQYSGTVKEVTDGALLIEKKGNTEAINLNFVVRIKEIQRSKK